MLAGQHCGAELISASARVEPIEAAPSGNIEVVVTCTSPDAVVVRIDVQVSDPDGRAVLGAALENQVFAAAETKRYFVQFLLPQDAREGTYGVAIGAQTPAVQPFFVWHRNLAQFSVLAQ